MSPRAGSPLGLAVHPCLGSARASLPLKEARLTDRQRVAVLLQGAGLLSFLLRLGWHLDSGWEESRIVAGGLLRVGEAAGPGRSSRFAQEALAELTARLFATEGEVAGRGEGRRAVRALLGVWRQSLVPLAPDDAVAQVLEAAPFLWEAAFGPARGSLVGELEDGRPWVAGPRPFRSRLLAQCGAGAAARALLAGPAARALWDREEAGEPRELAASGRWRAAVAAWARRPPTLAEERVEMAAALAALGRFSAALDAVSGLHSTAARALAAQCQLLLGQPGAARATLKALEEMPLPAERLVELAEVAARVFANGGEPERGEPWIRRALAETARRGGSIALRARLAAAGFAWDRRDLAAMDRLLEDSRAALDDPDLAWRWHHAMGLRATLDKDGGPRAAESFGRAVLAGRRRLARSEAAGLWNDLGLGRAAAGDLPGAERAFRHALRLISGCDGPRKTTLALFNIAEIRLRRGRLHGVLEILDRTETENRLVGNLRGLTEDVGLRMRYELALGRSTAALALCHGALAELDRDELHWQRPLRLLAARALGWLGRPAEAAAELAATVQGDWKDLEPEEVPALLALAGDGDGARREAAGTPFSPLWDCLCAGDLPPAPAWEALDLLEPYRAARLVLDAETLLPGAAPAHRLRVAAAVFRGLGATLPAARLEARDHGPWQSLAAYLGRPSGEGDPGGALAALFAGHPEVELVWTTGDGEHRVLAAGPGGSEELGEEVGEGGLVLRAPRLDAPLLALFALAARDLSPSAAGPQALPAPPRERGAAGMVGESPVFRAALARLDLLAPGDLPVLLFGESGTGKELAARRLHRASPRARETFLAINCAATSETLLLSDLFGHARGAFTGADREHKGLFESAERGTVLLDEIGDLPPAAQGMLLRVLQEGEVRRVGESAARRVNVRVLAATHRDLSQMVSEGSFRRDLYFRLRVGSVELPPLRDRGSDVLLLADHALARLHEGAPRRLTREARLRLLAHLWPGNVRELQNVLATAAALAGGGRIEPIHLELPESEVPAGAYHQQLDALRRQLVIDALAATAGERAAAARRLGISRQLLSYLARRMKIL